MADIAHPRADVDEAAATDRARDAGVEFTIQALHASAPTIVWEPQATAADTDVDQAFAQVERRIDAGVTMLEHDDGVPEWMAGATASALSQAASWFGDSALDGMSFLTDGKPSKLARQTFRTLDRVLHEETDDTAPWPARS